jgi:hypothetical protein
MLKQEQFFLINTFLTKKNDRQNKINGNAIKKKETMVRDKERKGS